MKSTIVLICDGDPLNGTLELYVEISEKDGVQLTRSVRKNRDYGGDVQEAYVLVTSNWLSDIVEVLRKGDGMGTDVGGWLHDVMKFRALEPWEHAVVEKEWMVRHL